MLHTDLILALLMITTELTKSLHKFMRNYCAWLSNSVQQKVLNAMKQAFSSSLILALYNGSNKPTIAWADLSLYGQCCIKTATTQFHVEPVMHMSQTLTNTE